MRLSPGIHLEPFEIVSLIGAGGTGEVYQARDTRLDRRVAIKILRSHLLKDTTARARLLHEARTISALNHPNIVTVHDVGAIDGVDFIVMELVEGETLERRLERQPLALTEVLRFAVDVCAALAAAHAHGIIHRDLKPANIILTKDQRVKVVDFGIARLLEPGDEQTDAATVTIEGTDTRDRLARGTAPYMSPEQVNGGHTDVRSDIFSFGAMFYEMVSGRRAFEGATTVGTMAAVLAGDVIPLDELAPGIPHTLERIVRRCLQKSPAARFQSVEDLKFALEAVREDLSAGVRDSNDSSLLEPAVIARRRRTRWRRLPWVFASVVMFAIGASGAWVWRHRATDNKPPVARTIVTLPANHELDTQPTASPLALSTDGRRLAYVAHAEGRTGLYVRTLDSFEPTAIAGTAGARYPFFSPDGHSVGFFADGKLKRVSIHGGLPLVICEVPMIGRGGTWGPDGTIVFASGPSPLMRVPATGGRPEPVTTRDPGMNARRLQWPQFLPGGRNILVTVIDQRPWIYRLFALSLDTGTWRELGEGAQAQYLSSGHLVFHAPNARDDELRAVAFDLEDLAFRGEPSPVVNGVFRSEDNGGAYFAASWSGSLVFAPGGYARTLVRVDRNGRRTALLDDRRGFRYPRLSPNGRYLAVAVDPRPSQLWIYDLARRSGIPLAARGLLSVWHPDGNRVTYGAFGGMYWRAADASSEAHLLLAGARPQYPNSWSKDGRTLIFNDDDVTNGLDIWQLPVDGEPRPLVATRARENWARLSPDGRWLAYTSDEFGRAEIHVRPFPNVDDGRWVVSTGGGVYPVWSPTGRELFYMNGTAMMSVPIETKDGRLNAGAPERLFVGPFETGSPQFDVSPDGTYFVMVEADPEAKPTHMRVILNWADELAQIATRSR